MRMTMAGLYRYDVNLFERCKFPQQLDRDVIIATILQEAEGRPVRYADADAMKYWLGMYTERRNTIWEKLYSSTLLDFNPIENYDRYEETETDESGSSTRTNTRTSTSTGTSSGTSTSSGGSTREATSKRSGYVSPFDAGDNVVLHDVNDDYNGDESRSNQTDNTQTHTGASTDEHNNDEGRDQKTGHVVSHIHGNIGVMRNDELLEGYRKSQMFDIYQAIAEDICDNFCMFCY